MTDLAFLARPPGRSFLAVAGFAVVCALLASGDEAAADPHDPIIIEGDGGLCLPGSGVVNCDTADGSAKAPYVISGWRIIAAPLLEPRCDHQGAVGILLCDVTAHVVVRDVEVVAQTGFPVDFTALGAPAPTAAVVLFGNSWVSLEDMYLETSGLAVQVDARGTDGAQLTVADSKFIARTSSSPMLELMHSRGTQVTLRGVVMDAENRNFGIQAVSTTSQTQHLDMQEVMISGPLLQAIQVQAGTLVVRDSNITMAAVSRLSGDTPANGVESSAISALNGARVTIQDTSIAFAGVGLSLNNASHLHVRGSSFAGSSSIDVAIELSADGTDPSAACSYIADFNDIGDLIVSNALTECDLQAPDNWWGGSAPRDDQIEGAVLVPSWAPVNLGEMARIELAHEPPPRIGSTMWLEGEATGPVSILRISGDMSAEMQIPPGPFAWEVPMQDAPLRELSLRLQACSPEFCGPPVDWKAMRGAASLPPVPVAILDPLVASPGQEVRVDASGSFSPADVPIVAYRYGDGPWTSEPSMTFVFDATGSYEISVHVQDQDGLQSQEPANVTLRVRESLAPAAAADSRDAGAPAVVWVLVAVGAMVRRWR